VRNSFSVKNWVEWHSDYERPDSSLSGRLEVVKRRLRFALDSVGPNSTILSLCSGEGRDVIGVLSEGQTKIARAVLVESNRVLADRARRAAKAAGRDEIEVRGADAGAVESFADLLPVEVLVLCGIFGNVEHGSVRRIVECVSTILDDGGYVVWTRGGSEPDRRSEIRKWFVDAGMEEVRFDGAPEFYGVGLNRLTMRADPARGLPARLFTFAES
jgi:hypothetical protein